MGGMGLAEALLLQAASVLATDGTGGMMVDPTVPQVLASYVLWIPLAVLAARDLRGEGNLRVASVVLILVVPPAGLLLWLLTRELWGRRNRESGGR